MLSFFRSLINSRLGIPFTIAFVVAIGFAFAAGDITGLRTGGIGAPGGDIAANVGSDSVSIAELKRRTQEDMQNFRQRQPTLDITQFVAEGGFEGTLDRLITGLAIEQFGRKIGMAVDKRVIDGQIANVPDLQGVDGKFDQKKYDALLAQRGLNDKQIRRDITRSIIAQQLTVPTEGASQVPDQLALPYASLLLERRSGTIGFVPTNAIDPGERPSEAELAAFYKKNTTRYTIPERRVIRYALVTPALVEQQSIPSEAEIAAAYKAQATRFAASEKRSLSQAVIADEAQAKALADKVKGGAAIDVAAKAIGFDAAKLTALDKAAYAAQTSGEIADAVFAGGKGAVVGPIKSPFGWLVVRVDSVEKIAARSLDAARADLTREIAAEKRARLLGEIHDKMDDALNDKATFAEIVADQKLQPVTTAPLIADGRDPDHGDVKPDPSLSQVVAAAFAAEPGDDPQLVPAGDDGSFAVVALDRIVPAAPPPLAKFHDIVLRDFVIERARAKARKIAVDVVASTNKGTPLALALAQAPIKLPPTRPLAAARAEIAANPQGAPAPLALLFSMAGKTAKLLEAPNNTGYYVIYLDEVEHHDASGKPQVVKAMRADIGKVVGREYVSQFFAALRKEIGVKKNDAAIAAARKDLAGGGR